MTPDKKLVATIRRALVAWFRRGHREMPWRNTRDPYAIWVSEIMLQQTRVEAVRGFYARWMARFPTVRTLADAPLDDVLALWSGLGYYARARNLKKAAELLTAKDGGEVPRDPLRLRALPGVGAYTAGAIASIAFELPEPILDGNVARVLSRVFAIDTPPEAAQTKKQLWSLAKTLVPDDAARDFNQAMMELGATVCVPRAPACLTCPLGKVCLARKQGRQEELPVRRVRREPPTVDALAVIARDGERVLLGRRAPRGLWGGLWEPPWVPLEGDDVEARAAKIVREAFGVWLIGRSALEVLDHELTHRRYRFHVLTGAVSAARAAKVSDKQGRYEELRWVEKDAYPSLGLAAWATRLLTATPKKKKS